MDILNDLSTFSASFSHRTATLPPGHSQLENPTDADDNDFLALMTCAADLYCQDGVLEMQESPRQSPDLAFSHGAGATSMVSRVTASFTQPSASESYRIQEHERLVVLKRYQKQLFKADGQPRDAAAARALVNEMRILGHPDVRKTPEIVTLLGLNWDLSFQQTPDPVIVLEYAEWDLNQFLKQHPSLPFDTKLQLSLNVAMGLAALHSFKIVHGDIKPQNILVFGPPYIAKIADFGHSVFDDGTNKRLVGGTVPYMAPEGFETCSASELKLTDVYSYGIVFANIMCGIDVMEKSRDCRDPNSLARMKQDDTLYQCLDDMARQLEDATVEDPAVITGVLELTVRKQPSQRKLDQAIAILSTNRRITLLKEECKSSEPVHRRLHNRVALEHTSNSVRDQVQRAIAYVATMPQDRRFASACWELSVCYCSDFGLPRTGKKDDQAFAEQALRWMVKSAEAGDVWARLAIVPVCGAFGVDVPNMDQVLQWLRDLALSGSVGAVSQLRRLYPHGDRELQMLRQRTYCENECVAFHEVGQSIGQLTSIDNTLDSKGNTILHYAASVGDLSLTKNILSRNDGASWINHQNVAGDTPLIQAARAGNTEIIQLLAQYGADGSILNYVKESALHFLIDFSNLDLESAAQALTSTGALTHLQTVSLDTTCSMLHRVHPIGRGTPANLAVLSGNDKVLELLFSLETVAQQPRLYTSSAILRRMLAYGVKLRHVKVVHILIRRLDKSKSNIASSRDVSPIQIWDNGRPRTIRKLWLLGSVSINPHTGLDWPEKFSRIMCFGPSQAEGVDVLFHLLNENGYISKDYHSLMISAIHHSRRDASRFLASFMFSSSSVRRPLQLWPAPGHNASQQADSWNDGTTIAQCRGVSQSESSQQSGFLGDGSLQRHSIPNLAIEAEPEPEPRDVVSSLKDHRRAWMLAEFVTYAVETANRAIFEDLLVHEHGLALLPGTKSCLFATASGKVFQEKHMRDVTSTFPRSWVEHIQPPLTEQFMMKYVRPKSYLPGCPQCEADRSKKEQRIKDNPPSELEKPEHIEFDGTFNYALMYMNKIAHSHHQDVSLAHILLSAMSQLMSDCDVYWTSISQFEHFFMDSMTQIKIVSPLLHATVTRWDELMVILLKQGASAQDMLDISLESVLENILACESEAYDHVLRLIKHSLSLGLDPTRILTHVDLSSILLHHQQHRFNLFWRKNHHNNTVPSTRLSSFYYTSTITWALEDGCYRLAWTKSRGLHQQEKDLWNAIAGAGVFSDLPLDGRHDSSYLITLAVMQQNETAVKYLLDAGLSSFSRPTLRTDVVASPKAFVSWIDSVPDVDCCTTGLELKHQYTRILRLLDAQTQSSQPHFSFVRLTVQKLLLRLSIGALKLSPAVATIWFYILILSWLLQSLPVDSPWDRRSKITFISIFIVVTSPGWLLLFWVAFKIGLGCYIVIGGRKLKRQVVRDGRTGVSTIQTLANIACGGSNTAVLRADKSVLGRLISDWFFRGQWFGHDREIHAEMLRDLIDDIDANIKYLVEASKRPSSPSPSRSPWSFLSLDRPVHGLGQLLSFTRRPRQARSSAETSTGIQQLEVQEPRSTGRNDREHRLRRDMGLVLRACGRTTYKTCHGMVSIIADSLAAAIDIADRVNAQERRRIARLAAYANGHSLEPDMPLPQYART